MTFLYDLEDREILAMNIIGLLVGAILAANILTAPLADATTAQLLTESITMIETKESESRVILLEEAAYTAEPRIANLSETGNQTSIFSVVLVAVAVAVALYLGNYLRRIPPRV